MSHPPRRLVLVVEDSSECAETLQIALESLPDTGFRYAPMPASSGLCWTVTMRASPRSSRICT